MRLPAIAALVCVGLASATSPALGKPPAKGESTSANDARARELYKQGDRAYAEGRYEDALESFEEAYRLSGRPLLLFNIGNALERLGRFEESATTLQKYVSYAEQAEVEVLEKRIANLRRRAEETKQREQGEHPEPATAHASSDEPPAEPEREPGRPADPAPSRDAASSETPTLGWVLVGAGGVGIAAGATLGFMALGARKDADAACKEQGGQKLCNASAKDAIDRDRRYSLFADVSLGLGLVAVGAGAWMLLTAPERPPGKRAGLSTGIAAAPRPGGGEVSLVGRF